MSVRPLHVVEAFLGSLLKDVAKWLWKKVGKWLMIGLGVVFLAVVGLLARWWESQPGWMHLLIVLAVVGVAVLGLQQRWGRAHAPAGWRRLEDKPEREPIPPWLRRQIIARDGGICGICGFRVKPGEEHIDHIHPVHAGGTNDPENLQTAHSECNLRKGGMVGWVPPYRRESA